MSEVFQTISRQLNEIIIRYVKFKSSLNTKLDQYMQSVSQKAESPRTTGMNKINTSNSLKEKERALQIAENVQKEADLFLKNIFELMDTFFYPFSKEEIELDESGQPKYSTLQDFHNGSLILNGKLVSPTMNKQTSSNLYLFIAMLIFIMGLIIAIFLMRIRKNKYP
jgi:hypothetical protein